MFASDLKNLQEAYQNLYGESDLLTDDLIEEVVEELIQECVEFGYTLDEASTAVENAAILYIDEAKVTYGSDTESPEQRHERAKAKVGEKRAAARKAAVKTAVGRVKAKVKGAAAGAGIAASIAKDEARRAGRAATHAVGYAVQKKKAEVKTGVKSLIGRGLRKAAGAVGKVAQKAAGAASRLGEEVKIEEAKQSFPFKKVAAQQEKARKGSVYGKPATNEPTPNVSDKEKKETGRFSKMHQASEKAKREKQVADKARRSSTFYKDTHPASAPKMKKANEEIQVDAWDLVLEYLITNGHADTNEEALYVMSQLDEETILGIVEAQHARENPEKYEREQRSKETRGQSAERRVRDRLSTMDPEKAAKMKAQMRSVGLNV